jgi:hypothetical protein
MLGTSGDTRPGRWLALAVVLAAVVGVAAALWLWGVLA